MSIKYIEFKNLVLFQVLVSIFLVTVQIVGDISCLPFPTSNELVISSYSNVRLQQPRIGLSVESEMPKEMLMNPKLADEPPLKVDKVESIFMLDQPIKGLQKMDIDDMETMMRSINERPEVVGFDITKSDIQLKTMDHIVEAKDLLMMFPTQQSTEPSTTEALITTTTSTTTVATTNEPTTSSSTTTVTTTTTAVSTTEDNLLSIQTTEEATTEPIDLPTTTIESLDDESEEMTTERT